MKKLALVLALAALNGCSAPDNRTAHITCWQKQSGVKLYEGEASNVHSRPTWAWQDDVRFTDEDGQPVTLDNASCLVETNRPRYEP